MAKLQSSLAARPKSLDALIGQDKLVKNIRNLVKSGRIPKTWLFSGEKGTGKTTVARILALALECAHDVKFGSFCKECKKLKSSYQIFEADCAKLSGVDKISDFISTSTYVPQSPSKYRVYILDEAHRLSDAAQTVLLKPVEDGTPNTSKFIFCSTSPDKISETIRSRCKILPLLPLKPEDVKKLCLRLLERINCDYSAAALADALTEKHIFVPRLIANAVDSYAAGASPEEASTVDGISDLDPFTIVRAVIKGGNWSDVCDKLRNATPSDLRSIRVSMIGYMKTMLIETPEKNSRNNGIAKGILALSRLTNMEDMAQAACVAAELYNLCVVFDRHTG